MPTTSPQVDAYIAKAAEFARPILRKIRSLMHQACPDVEETMKWSTPHFTYKGMLGGMAAFKHHCAFGFWKGSLIVPKSADEKAAGQFGRITKVSDLPPKKVIAGYVKEAMRLNEEGVTSPARAKPKAAKPVVVPDALVAALRKNAKARKTFEAFSASHQREYAEWIGDAKGEDTRRRRVETAIEWLAEGKARNWKYQ